MAVEDIADQTPDADIAAEMLLEEEMEIEYAEDETTDDESDDTESSDDESLEENEDLWLVDAKFAGGCNSQQCTLILTQGIPTSTLALNGVVALRDWKNYGVFPLAGELLNVREASLTEVMGNPIFETIIKILGLELHKIYTTTESLRYGRLMIMTADQDHYGSYIKGLVINFLHMFWPSLLKLPSFLSELITPLIVKATKEVDNGIEKRVFYSLPEYEAWRESLRGNADGWTIKKGVAYFYDQGKEYFESVLMQKKDFVWVDERDGEAIELAFSKKFEVGSLQSGIHLDYKEELVKYSDFILKELIPFGMPAVLRRSIPSLVDGLKPHQRKIIFGSFKRDNLIKEEVVAYFAHYVSEHSARPVSEHSAYHHDEQNLDSTIIKMAQDYVGSNNIHLLEPRSLFGTRQSGGKNHGTVHHLFTRLSPITRFLFPEDDDRLLDYLHEDGKSIEPTWYVPIIPMVLVNGSEGIGPAGWSSYIPSYNPRDIVKNVKCLISNDTMVPMDPWYRGFTGSIEKTVTESGVCYTTRGIIEKVDDTTLRIIELPIGMWTEEYLEFLNSISKVNDEAKDAWIEDYRQFFFCSGVDILVYLSDTHKNLIEASEEDLCKKFKLTTSISTSNMHLFDPKGEIKKYDTPEQILEEFFHLRLQFYEKRKTVLLLILRSELLNLENKVGRMRGVLDGGELDFDKLSTDPYLNSMPFICLCKDKFQIMLKELSADIDTVKQKIKKLEGSPPRTLWLEDLAALEHELDKLEKSKAKNAEAIAGTRVTSSSSAMGTGIILCVVLIFLLICSAMFLGFQVFIYPCMDFIFVQLFLFMFV